MLRFFVMAASVFIASVVSASQTKAGPNTVTPGKYHCMFFINGALQTTPGFVIQKDGPYVHESGSKGRYSYDAGIRPALQ
jgi:hypothetical protein